MTVQLLDRKEKVHAHYLYRDMGISIRQIAEMYVVSESTIRRSIKEVNPPKDETIGIDVLEREDVELEEPEEDAHFSVVATQESIAITKVTTDGDVDSVSVAIDNDLFEQASNIIWSAGATQESIKEAYELLDVKTMIEKFSNGKINVDPEAGTVTYSAGSIEQQFHGRLVPRLITALQDQEDSFEGLVAFAEKLTNNPSNRAVNELYDFLEASCIDIDANGNVICFKKVRGDYTDIFSGTFDNSIGSVCAMPRNMVNEDSNQTCSHGLHVCSSSYLPFFGSSSSNKIVKVVVDPADFVSIPIDYNHAKARVSRYEVVEDVTDQFIDDF